MVGQWVEKGGGSVGGPKEGGVAPDTEAWIIMVQL